jgi:hypothetical protein
MRIARLDARLWLCIVLPQKAKPRLVALKATSLGSTQESSNEWPLYHHPNLTHTHPFAPRPISVSSFCIMAQAKIPFLAASNPSTSRSNHTKHYPIAGAQPALQDQSYSTSTTSQYGKISGRHYDTFGSQPKTDSSGSTLFASIKAIFPSAITKSN